MLVIGEQRGGKLNRATWEAVAAAQLSGEPLKIALLGSGADSAATEIAAAEASEVVILEAEALADYTADGYVLALKSLIEQEKPSAVVFPHTYQTRDFAPALATRLGRALITDVTAVKKSGNGVAYLRPVFQGKLNADVEG